MRVKKKRKIKLRFKLILLACFLAYTGYAIYAQQMNINGLQQEKQTLTEQYQQAQSDLNRLEHQRRYMGTDKYVEDAAREKFGLTYEDEIILEPKE
jgi:cell division protein FtsL